METPMSNSELYFRFNGKYATKESNERIQVWYSAAWTNDEIKKRYGSKAINLVWVKIKICSRLLKSCIGWWIIFNIWILSPIIFLEPKVNTETIFIDCAIF